VARRGAPLARKEGFTWQLIRTWDKFHKWVVAEYAKDPDAFDRFFKAMRDEGKYAKWTPDKIRMNPEPFMDTGWPQFSNVESTNPYKDLPNYTKERLEKEG